jgi:type VI protein secretion system component Hcp
MPIYMKFEGIEGPVTGQYKGWIELKSCQLGTNRSVTSAAGRGANREAESPRVSEIVITKEQDSTSNNLFRASLWGEGKKVTIAFVHGNDAPYLTLELEDTLVSNFSVSGSGGDDRRKPTESLSLNFTKIRYKTMAATKDPEAAKERASWQLAH